MFRGKLDKKIVEGLDYLVSTDFSAIEDGKYVINDDMYMNVQTYETKTDALYEAHRCYADIQYMIEGCEKIGVTPYSSCSTEIEYDSEKDIEFLNGQGRYYELKTGEYMVLYPEDAHKPSISDTKTKVRKAVLKVRVK